MLQSYNSRRPRLRFPADKQIGFFNNIGRSLIRRETALCKMLNEREANKMGAALQAGAAGVDAGDNIRGERAPV